MPTKCIISSEFSHFNSCPCLQADGSGIIFASFVIATLALLELLVHATESIFGKVVSKAGALDEAFGPLILMTGNAIVFGTLLHLTKGSLF